MAKSRIGPAARRSLSAHIKSWFSTNILLKIAALALAIFLWFHSATTMIHQEQYTIPITVVVEDTTLVDVVRDHGKAKVLLEGQGKEFMKLLWNKPRFAIDVDEKKPRTMELVPTPQDVIIPTGVALKAVAVLEPPSVTVELDWLTEKTVTVLPIVERLEEGFIQKGKVTTQPSEVTLRGARGELKGLKNIPTVPIALPASSGEFELITRLDLSGYHTITCSEEAVKVRGEIERIIERKLENIPVEITGAMKKDYRARPATIEIIVTGMESRISNLTPEQIRAVLEINNPPSGETYYSPKIVLPDDVELISEQPKLFQAVSDDSLTGESSP